MLKHWVQETSPGVEPGLAELQPPEDLPSPEKKATITGSKVQPEPVEQSEFSGRTKYLMLGVINHCPLQDTLGQNES